MWLLAASPPMGDEHHPAIYVQPERGLVGVGAPTVRFDHADPGAALERLHRAEATIASELAAVREAIVQIEAVLVVPASSSSLLTVVEAARELRVSRSRVFQLLAAVDFQGVRVGRARCVPRRSVEAFLARLGSA